MAQRPKKPIRRAGLITPFGTGAIVDYADGESLITSAIDHWPDADEACPHSLKIEEDRLCQSLNISEIRFPPDYDRGRNPIPAARFPKWHHCPRCHSLRGNVAARDCATSECNQARIKTQPMRFIAICANGHIDDIDWMRWVHGDEGGGEECRLTYNAGRSSSLAGINISCSCGLRRTLAGLFSRAGGHGGLGQPCKGNRPWLGPEAQEPCDLEMQAAQKGASNVYFPKVESAIFVPDWTREESNRIDLLLDDPNIWEAIDASRDDDDAMPSRRMTDRFASLHSVDQSSFYAAAVARLKGEEEPGETELKPAEYQSITSCAGSPDEELYVKQADIGKYQTWVREYLSGVYLVPKLRETRVLSGFTRIQPPAGSGRDRIQSVTDKLRWLPGIKVTGEGFLLAFDDEKIREYCSHPIVEKRAAQIEENINRVNAHLGREAAIIHPGEVLIHTFAHLLIRAISYECGYGSSALRERIYFDLEADNVMAGVLIYTASGDSEGSLGGIVRQAEPSHLERSIRLALDGAEWCSSDPICSETSGQGSSGANLAACHACALLPETSCEYGNRLLDRMLVVGTAENRSIGFFGNLMND